ncbi:MAG: hypothetical protein R6W48_12870 [Gaiellaceae bacterium]
MAGKQIDFPPNQKEVSWIARASLAISIICIAIVVILLLADVDGPFLGPWG